MSSKSSYMTSLNSRNVFPESSPERGPAEQFCRWFSVWWRQRFHKTRSVQAWPQKRTKNSKGFRPHYVITANVLKTVSVVRLGFVGKPRWQICLPSWPNGGLHRLGGGARQGFDAGRPTEIVLQRRGGTSCRVIRRLRLQVGIVIRGRGITCRCTRSIRW